MGGSASRELEAVQSQVRLLTVKLQKASAQLQQRPALTKAAEAAEQRQAQLQAELQAQSQQLASSNAELSELRSVKASLPRIKEEVSAAREELLQVKTSKQEQISELQSALRASKEELEELFGKLKFAEQEGLAMRQKRASNLSDDKRELIVQQQAVAASSALLVAEASAALCGDFGTHPVYGTLLADLGYKRLYRGSPATLWAGTLLWERQRAFRQARASLIATAKARSPVEGWPGSITIVESTEAATGGSGDAGGNSGSSGSTIGVLIDGQHRLGAAHVLSNRGKLEGSLSSILVEVRGTQHRCRGAHGRRERRPRACSRACALEFSHPRVPSLCMQVYPPMSGQGIKDLFTEINRAEPVLLIDLPDDGATSSDNAILTEAAEVLLAPAPVACTCSVCNGYTCACAWSCRCSPSVTLRCSSRRTAAVHRT